MIDKLCYNIEISCSIVIWKKLLNTAKTWRFRGKSSLFLRKMSFFQSYFLVFQGLYIRFFRGISSSSRMSSKEQMIIKQGFLNLRKIYLGNLVMDHKQRSYFETFQKYFHNKYFFLNKIPKIRHESLPTRLINEVF